MEGGRAGGDIDGGKPVGQKTRTKLEGRLYLTKIGYIVAPKNFLRMPRKS